MGIICDRCGREMNDWWEIKGMPGVGGNCTYCGENLCAKCAGGWDEDGECKECQNTGKSYEKMTIRELEFLLPLTIQVREKMENPYPGCTRKQNRLITYRQYLWRSDSCYTDDKKHRIYEISYREQYDTKKVLFHTARHNDLKAVLIDAHQRIDELGLKNYRRNV